MCCGHRWNICLLIMLQIVGAFTMGCGSSSPKDKPQRARVGDDVLYEATSSESQARVRSVLPTKGSEDVSNLLGSINSHAERSKNRGERDYLPDMATDWVIDVRFDGDPLLPETGLRPV